MKPSSTPRRFSRVHVPAGIPILCEGFSIREWFRATNLSQRGFFAVTRKPLAPSTVLMVSFYGPGGRHISSVAVVRDVVPGEGMGMEFCFLPPSFLETLSSWITPAQVATKDGHTSAPSTPIPAQK